MTTLRELDVKVGDVVEFVAWNDGDRDGVGSFAYGKRYTIKADKADSGSGYFYLDNPHKFRLIYRTQPTAWSDPSHVLTTTYEDGKPDCASVKMEAI